MEMKKFGTIAMLILLLAAGCTQTASEQGSSGGENKQQFDRNRTASVDCYSLGYRQARYVTLGLIGLQGPPEDEHLVIPVECRFDESTKRGMRAATEDVFKKYNIKGIGRSGTIIYK